MGRTPLVVGGWQGPPNPRAVNRRAPVAPQCTQNHSPLCRLRRWELWIWCGLPSQSVARKASFGQSLAGPQRQLRQRPLSAHHLWRVVARAASSASLRP